MSEGKLAPTHPGEVLLEDFLVELGISQYRVAKDIGGTAKADQRDRPW
jgi:plasmid maintenance system antidote protein VapI